MVIFCTGICRAGGTPHGISVKIMAGKTELIPGEDQTWTLPGGTQLNSLRFYLCNLQWVAGGRPLPVGTIPGHLVDLHVPGSLSLTGIPPRPPGASHLRFLLGVDSSLQAGGIGGGALDPALGMYWTWQSGYIHIRTEGRFVGENKDFQYHLGGFQGRQNSLCTITLSVPQGQGMPVLCLDVAAFLEQARKSETRSVMSPGNAAVSLARLFAGLFTLSAP